MIRLLALIDDNPVAFAIALATAAALNLAFLWALCRAAARGGETGPRLSLCPPPDDARSSGRASVAEPEPLQAVNKLSPVQQTTLEGE